MSDRWRTVAGLLLAAAGLAGCLISALPPLTGGEEIVLRGETTGWILAPIETAAPGTVAVNSASAEALTELPGIGPALGQLIVEERKQNGVYYFPEDLTAVKGIGLKKLEGFREMLDMNTSESGEN